ncbi:mobile element protein [Vibrio ishigakensis]|uniref:Mobile element protein n=1 Tax=Vibrio ishigakensis TaxID=1481914 RepID=A0A0B8QI72_9VIBR|nr:mobile element protein [Vibrio ishigakensis]
MSDRKWTESALNNFRKMLTKVTVETALNVEFDEHLGYEKHSPKPSSNSLYIDLQLSSF